MCGLRFPESSLRNITAKKKSIKRKFDARILYERIGQKLFANISINT
jgi:hypothetical protein